MKKRTHKAKTADTQPEYDFTGKKGERGKYYEAYRQGHTVRIQEADGGETVRHFTLEEGAVLLEPDVKAYFPTSEAVNQTLRSLIALIPDKTPPKAPGPKGRP